MQRNCSAQTGSLDSSRTCCLTRPMRLAVSIYRQTPSGPLMFSLFLCVKKVFGEFVLRACLSHCICRLLAAPFLLLSVPCGWQGCCCPNRRGSLTELASWRCLAKDMEAKQSKRRGGFGRHVLGSKAPRRQTKSLKRNFQSKKDFPMPGRCNMAEGQDPVLASF